MPGRSQRPYCVMVKYVFFDMLRPPIWAALLLYHLTNAHSQLPEICKGWSAFFSATKALTTSV